MMERLLSHICLAVALVLQAGCYEEAVESESAATPAAPAAGTHGPAAAPSSSRQAPPGSIDAAGMPGTPSPDPSAVPAAPECAGRDAALPPAALDALSPQARLEQADALRHACPAVAVRLYRSALPGLEPGRRAYALLRIGYLQLNALPDISFEEAYATITEGIALSTRARDMCGVLKGKRLLIQLYTSRSELEAADRTLQEALDRLDTCTDRVGAASTWFQAAEVRRQQNRQLDELEALETAIQLSQPDGPDLLLYETRRAALRHDLGDVADEGAAYLELLDQVRGREPQLELELLLDLVNLYRDLHRLDQAQAALGEAYALLERSPQLERKRPVVQLMEVWLALEAGDATRAHTVLEAVPSQLIADREARKQHLWLYLQGRLRFLEGDTVGARRRFDDIVNDARAERELHWRAKLELARVDEAQGQAEAARHRLWEAVNDLDKQRQETAGAFLELAWLSQREGLYARWLESLVGAWRRGGLRSSPPSDDGQVGLQQRLAGGPVTADDLLAAVEKVSSQAFTARLYRESRGMKGFLEARGRGDALGGPPGDWITGAALRGLLPPGVPVLVYQPLEHHLLVLAVHRERVDVYLRDIEDGALEKQILELEDALQRDRQAPPPSLDAIGELLLEPVKSVLAGGGSIGFVMQRGLEGVPLPALRLDGQYLVQRCYPFELPNLRSARLLRRYAPAQGPLDALGVAFGADLANARREVQLLRTPAFQPRLLVGPQATVRAVREALSTPDVIHLALHSTAPTEVRDGHGRVIQRTTGQIQVSGGTVSSRDLQALNLKARLAVLSGCESRQGRPGMLEHGYGALHRAVLLAGAEAVIASRWEVGDEVTYRLMQALYARFPRVGRAEALARAQRDMLASAATTMLTALSGTRSTLRVVDSPAAPETIPDSAPWSWAAFTLVGRWD